MLCVPARGVTVASWAGEMNFVRGYRASAWLKVQKRDISCPRRRSQSYTTASQTPSESECVTMSVKVLVSVKSKAK